MKSFKFNYFQNLKKGVEVSKKNVIINKKVKEIKL